MADRSVDIYAVGFQELNELKEFLATIPSELQKLEVVKELLTELRAETIPPRYMPKLARDAEVRLLLHARVGAVVLRQVKVEDLDDEGDPRHTDEDREPVVRPRLEVALHLGHALGRARDHTADGDDHNDKIKLVHVAHEVLVGAQANEFEDAIGSGATLREAVEKLGGSLVTVESVSRNGRDINGALITGEGADLVEDTAVLDLIWSSDVNETSVIQEGGDDFFFAVSAILSPT